MDSAFLMVVVGGGRLNNILNGLFINTAIIVIYFGGEAGFLYYAIFPPGCKIA